MQVLRSSLPSFRDPVWLLFVPPLLGRGWLLLKYDAPALWTAFVFALLILFGSAFLTWLCAALLARSAGLSERGRERFTVMSTLGALALPLAFALKESLIWRSSMSLRAFTLPTTQMPFAVNCVRSGILLILALAIFLAVGSCLLAKPLRSTILRRLFLLTRWPLVCSIGICLLYIASYALNMPGVLQQNALFLLAFALPFFIAALFTTPYMLTAWYHERGITLTSQRTIALHVTMLVLVALYFGGQLYTYCF